MSKLTLQLSPELESILDEYAEDHDVSKSHIIRRALMLLNYLEEQIDDNRDLLLRDRTSGDIREVVLEGSMERAIARKFRSAGDGD